MSDFETSPPWPPLDLVRWYESKIAAAVTPMEQLQLENELASHYPAPPSLVDKIIAANGGSNHVDR